MLVASIERKVLLERLARVEEQGKTQKRFFQPRWAEELG